MSLRPLAIIFGLNKAKMRTTESPRFAIQSRSYDINVKRILVRFHILALLPNQNGACKCTAENQRPRSNTAYSSTTHSQTSSPT